MGKRFVVLIFSVLLISSFSLVSGQKKKPPVLRDTIQVIGHAHMDMNWLWNYAETMQMCNDNLRQVVAFMQEYPDFTMIQSQASVYNFVENVDPPLFDLVKKYVKEGRLELGGGMWTEGDMNLSTGEAIARSFLLGQRYFQSRFGKRASIGWLPDNFGHISQMPQILKLAGCDYFYFHRTKPYIGTFWWVAPDSSRILCYANDTYNGNITPDLKNEIQKFSPDKRRILQITGVGDHGGGPTRANIEMVHQLDKIPGYPSVKFTTAGDFFKKASREMDGRPTHHGEMQFIFEGCYTNVSDIKAGNRNCENALFASEFFNTLCWLNGEQYPDTELTDLWKNLTFNQFHDILPGSAINESNKESIARYTETLRKTNELRNIAFRKMADEIKFQTGIGQPVVAYNLQPFKRKALIEANVYSNNEPVTAKLASWGDYYGSKYIKPSGTDGNSTPSVLVRDANGRTYPAQVIWGKSTPPGFTMKVEFVADDMPAGGYRTFYLDLSKQGESSDPILFNGSTFETDFFKIRFDMKTGGISSLIDKRTGKEFVRAGGKLNNLRIYLEDKKGSMKSWTINKIVKQEDVTNVKSVTVVEKGPVRACIETVKTWGKSRFIERTYLYRSYPRIDYDMEIHWLETGNDSTDSPMLRAVFPIDMQGSGFYSQVPFDVVERPVDGKLHGKDAPAYLRHEDVYGITAEANDGQEVPAQKWVDVSDGNVGIALLNKTKYGHSYHNGDLRLTLLRTAGEPDIYPNLGKFTISYSLFPHSGDWKNGVWAEGEDFNIPVYCAEPPSLALVRSHATLTEEKSFFSLDAGNITITGIKRAEDGNELILRLAEVDGKGGTVSLSLPSKVSNVRRLNLLELPLENAAVPQISGNLVKVSYRPKEIITLGLTLSDQ
ncbi:MAG: glycoside hydrolase family 38 C-terminal domain-containing protein [Bacteroidota bacterium]|nr:glycoside hydrolase family 38 C-terminal domain-containing protein [Bacteroidota bacterium]